MKFSIDLTEWTVRRIYIICVVVYLIAGWVLTGIEMSPMRTGFLSLVGILATYVVMYIPAMCTVSGVMSWSDKPFGKDGDS